MTEYENVTLYPLDLVVLKKSESLTEVTEIHDRMIVATALVWQGEEIEPAILTKDENITQSELVLQLDEIAGLLA